MKLTNGKGGCKAKKTGLNFILVWNNPSNKEGQNSVDSTTENRAIEVHIITPEYG